MLTSDTLTHSPPNPASCDSFNLVLQTTSAGKGRRAPPRGSVHQTPGRRRRAARNSQGCQGQPSCHARAALQVLPRRKRRYHSRQVHSDGYGLREWRDGAGSRQRVWLQGTWGSFVSGVVLVDYLHWPDGRVEYQRGNCCSMYSARRYATFSDMCGMEGGCKTGMKNAKEKQWKG